MKLIAALVFLPGAAMAQSFDAPPVFTVDGTTAEPAAIHSCVSELAAGAPNALVSFSASDCIGLMAEDCAADPVTCAGLEQSYWDWRITQNYVGLQAWVSAKPEGARFDGLRASVADPAGATAIVPLECAMRINMKDQPGTAALDIAKCEMRETALIALELEFTVRQACVGATEEAFVAFCAKDAE
jgi:hypothetical protein